MDQNLRGVPVLGKILVIVLASFAVISLISIIITFILPQGVSTASQSEASQAVLGVIVILTILLLLLPVILLPIWAYNAFSNLIRAGVSDLAYSPTWAGAAWFVPFANLVMPLKIMREIYNRSHGEDEIQSASGVGHITSWWACSIAAVIVIILGMSLAIIQLSTNIYFTMPDVGILGIFVLVSIFQFGSAIYLAIVVHKISKAQESGLHLGQAGVFS